MTAEDILDLTDDALAEAYLNDKKLEKEIEVRLKNTKAEAFIRLDDKGVPYGKTGNHRIIDTAKYEIKKEVRITKNVITSEAITLFQANKWLNEIESTSTISIRKSVKPADIPVALLTQMDAWFDIEVHKTVSKEALELKLQQKAITEDQFKICIFEKIVNALTIIKK